MFVENEFLEVFFKPVFVWNWLPGRQHPTIIINVACRHWFSGEISQNPLARLGVLGVFFEQYRLLF